MALVRTAIMEVKVSVRFSSFDRQFVLSLMHSRPTFGFTWSARLMRRWLRSLCEAFFGGVFIQGVQRRWKPGVFPLRRGYRPAFQLLRDWYRSPGLCCAERTTVFATLELFSAFASQVYRLLFPHHFAGIDSVRAVKDNPNLSATSACCK